MPTPLYLLRCLPKGKGALASLKGSPVTERAARLGLEVHCVGTHKLDPRIGRKLNEVIQSGGFQVVDSQNPQARFWASRVRALSGVAHVATLNSWPSKEYSGYIKGSIYRLLDNMVKENTDYFVAVSAEIKSELSTFGVVEDRIALITNAIDMDWSAVTADVEWLRATYHIPAGAPVCCAVGRLTEVKGFCYLIDGISRSASHAESLHCLIMGEGDSRRLLEKQIATLGLHERVRLLGEKDHRDVLKIVNACDFFVMPSLSEGTPLALLEAAALSKPIIASDVGGIPDVLTHERNGLLVPPANACALSEALAWVCENRMGAMRLGQQAREDFVQKFTMQRLLDQLIQVYRKAIELRTALKGTHGT